jgi:aspartyl/asparaginyl-tRNA synthetase
VAESSIASYSEVQRLTTGAAIAVKGTLVQSPAKGQKYEIKASEVKQGCISRSLLLTFVGLFYVRSRPLR